MYFLLRYYDRNGGQNLNYKTQNKMDIKIIKSEKKSSLLKT